jgi:hypothetical protein
MARDSQQEKMHWFKIRNYRIEPHNRAVMVGKEIAPPKNKKGGSRRPAKDQ